MILKQKRHLCLFAAAWIFGTALYCRKEDVWLPILILIGALLTFGAATGEKRMERIIASCLIPALILAAFLVCGYHDRSASLIQEMLETSPGTELSGTVIKKEIRSDQFLYHLKTPYKKVIVYFDSDEIPIGSEVTVRGAWKAFSPATNEGSFDYSEYYRDQNISFRIFADGITVQSEPALGFREGLYWLQRRISSVFADALNAGEAGVMSALTVGNRGLLDPDVRQMYQDAGISHILAISGLHISILGFGLYRFLRKIRVPCHVCEAVGCGVMLCFVLMSGMSVSAVRALVMYLVMMGAHASGRTYDPMNALALAAMVLLIPNPMNLYRSGFQFSFLAMAAIVLYNAVSEKRGREREKCGEKAADPAGLTGNNSGREELPGPVRTVINALNLKERLLFGAFLQMAMLPLTAWHYYEVPLYATFLNLIILPLCSALLGFGLAGGLLGMVFPQAAKWILIPCHVILRIYEGSVNLVNRLPLYEWISGKPPAWLLLVFYLVMAGMCGLYLLDVRKNALFLQKSLAAKHIGRVFFSVSHLSGFIKRHAAVCMMAPIILLGCILFVPERQYCRIDFLDVGQGDGIFLTDGAGTRVMIDGGSSSESSVGTYEIEPFLKYHGIKKIDAWILTHGDSDHYSGLLELLEGGYPVNYLLLAEAMPRDETWEKLVSAALENGTELVYVTAGDGIALKDCEMTCLYPAAEDGSGAAGEEETKIAEEDANEFSQVWLLEKGDMSVMFTGDLGEDQERILLEREALSDCAVLKVAHHGSKYSSCAEFLEAVSPEYAVISCGANNIYGHPAQETLDRLADAGCEIYRTPQCGQITVYEKRERWRMHIYLQ